MGAQHRDCIGWDLVHLLRDLGEEGFSGVVDARSKERTYRLFWNHGALVLAHCRDVNLSYPAYLMRNRVLNQDRLQAFVEEAKNAEVSLEDVLLSYQVLDTDTLARHKRLLSLDVVERMYLEPKLHLAWADLHPAPEGWEPKPVLYLAAFFRAVGHRADPEELGKTLEPRLDFRLHLSEAREGFLYTFDKVFRAGNPPPYLDGSQRVGDLISGPDGQQRLREIFALTWLRVAWFHRSDPPDVSERTSDRVWEEVVREFGKVL